eukprot:scaffold3359_cov123-Cylindrotheca_fusiformis.AAC.15
MKITRLPFSSMLLLYALAGIIVTCSLRSCTATKTAGLGIAAYLPDYRAGYNVNASAPHLTDLILFSIQPHSRGMIGGCCLQSHHFQLGRNAREHNPELRVWVTIGGAGRAEAIPAITADAGRRKTLIDSVSRLSLNDAIVATIAGSFGPSQGNDLFGIDLDIYYPRTHQQLSDYVRFVREASEVWHEKNIQISVTWHPQRMSLPPAIFDLVDRVNLMAYDMMTAAGQHHAEMMDTKRAVESLSEQGCPADKIWLGIPFYGRNLQNPGHAETFEALYKRMQSTFRERYNQDNTSHFDGFEWDSPKQIEMKVEYAYTKNLGGIFFWELGQDYQEEPKAPGGILLEAASIRRRELLSTKQDEL